MSALIDLSAEAFRGEADFRARIIEPCRPAVIRGLARDWPLTRAAARSAEDAAHYLKGLDAGRLAEAFVGDKALAGRYHYDAALTGFNFARETIGLGPALDRIVVTRSDPTAPTLYLGSLPADSYVPGFAEAHRTGLLPDAIVPRLWIGHASTVACHHDNSDNLACVAAGTRRFTLFPPDAIGDLYVGPIDHTMAGQPVSLAVGSPAGDPRFPRFETIRDQAIVAELAPGDAIYIPKLWWHAVEATGPFNILVNFWWDAFQVGPDSPYTTMLLAMAAIADRPAAERAAWRAYFDHYVFRSRGHPLAHLPEDRHGLLGRGAHGRLRAIVMRLLRGG